MAQGSALVVDDQTYFTGSLQRELGALDVEITLCADPLAAINLLDGNRYHVLFCNPLANGRKAHLFLREVQRRNLLVPLVLFTNDPKWNNANPGLRLGVFACLPRPVSAAVFRAVLRRALLRSGLLLKTGTPLAPAAVHPYPLMVANSPHMAALLAQVPTLADSDSPICISGESGTGKEWLARMIHYSGRRADHPLVVCDCRVTPEYALEAELFGHGTDGASGAPGREGALRLADGGTVFLDEIGALPLSLQGRVLRVLETGDAPKRGEKTRNPVNIRIIAGASMDIAKLIREKRMREALCAKLQGVRLSLPPLRERKEDISLLVEQFVAMLNRISPKQLEGVTSRAMAALLRHDWPGNVRELQQCIERATLMADGKRIDLQDIMFLLHRGGRPAPATVGSRRASLKECERLAGQELILKTLHDVKGNRTRAAKLLRISVRSLQYKLKTIDTLGSAIPSR